MTQINAHLTSLKVEEREKRGKDQKWKRGSVDTKCIDCGGAYVYLYVKGRSYGMCGSNIEYAEMKRGRCDLAYGNWSESCRVDVTPILSPTS